jgi:hypothetical protein
MPEHPPQSVRAVTHDGGMARSLEPANADALPLRSRLEIGDLYSRLDAWKTMREQGRETGSLTGSISHTLFEVLDRAVCSLSEQQSRIVAALFTHPDRLVNAHEVARLARLPDDECVTALEELFAAGIVRLFNGCPGTLDGQVFLDQIVRLAEATRRNHMTLRLADVQRCFNDDDLG